MVHTSWRLPSHHTSSPPIALITPYPATGFLDQTLTSIPARLCLLMTISSNSSWHICTYMALSTSSWGTWRCPTEMRASRVCQLRSSPFYPGPMILPSMASSSPNHVLYYVKQLAINHLQGAKGRFWATELFSPFKLVEFTIWKEAGSNLAFHRNVIPDVTPAHNSSMSNEYSILFGANWAHRPSRVSGSRDFCWACLPIITSSFWALNRYYSYSFDLCDMEELVEAMKST